MPTNRFNYSDDFVLNNGKVGINSASPQEKLDVVGITKAENLSVVGVSSLTGYEGFLRANHNVAESISLEGGQGITGSLSGEIIVGTGVTVTGVTTATSGQGYIDSLKVYNTFTVPVGLTNDRPTAPKPGQLYYNKDFASIEFYDGDRWRQVDNTTQRGRGVFGGGDTPTRVSTIDFVNIQTTGNAINFGNLTVARSDVSSGVCASSVRGMFVGGGPGSLPNLNVIDYITIASEGNAIDFGDTTQTSATSSSCSSSTRGVFGGGGTPTLTNVIDYITIATIGNALDFGDLTIARAVGTGLASPTRGVFGGGVDPAVSSRIDFVTIASTGNAVTFGNLTQARRAVTAFANTTRGIFIGGSIPGYVKTVDYITIASAGNALTFGELNSNQGFGGGCGSQTRGLIGGGYDGSAILNVIQYVTISTTGNAIDFGDLTQARNNPQGTSDSHGGLGGF